MKRIQRQKISHKAFTLIEMVIVLIIMGILLMFTVFLSGDQIQKIKNKSVKESILSEMQTYYSRNLWSSSFGWIMYNTLEVKLANWENKIDFKYNARNSKDNSKEISFTNSFTIEYLAIN